jgi:Methyltransferase FkbM domain
MGMRSALGRWTLRHGYFFERAARHESVDSFLRTIRPIVSDHSLIRLGPQTDGGYLVPDDLVGIEACFSPGVKDSSDFEADIAARGIPCYLADLSVDGPPVQNPLFDFEKKFVGAVNNADFMTLDAWVNAKLPGSSDLLLQMDIEGYEYETILSATESLLRRFRIMVIEFHGLDGIFSKRSLPIMQAVFAKILNDFEIVHIHANNCLPNVRMRPLSASPVVEFTFLRKDRIRTSSPNRQFPHPLDRINKPNVPLVVLPPCWYSGK